MLQHLRDRRSCLVSAATHATRSLPQLNVWLRSSNLLVLPFSGVFSKYDAPGRYVIGTPSHAVFIAADTPYRLGFPGAIGDRALTFRFDEDLAPEQLDGSDKADGIASHGLLSANAMMLRTLL